MVTTCDFWRCTAFKTKSKMPIVGLIDQSNHSCQKIAWWCEDLPIVQDQHWSSLFPYLRHITTFLSHTRQPEICDILMSLLLLLKMKYSQPQTGQFASIREWSTSYSCSWTFSLSPSQWRRGLKQGNFKAQKKSCHRRGYGWDFSSHNTLQRCPHKVLRSPILPALYQPWTTVAKELTQPGEVPQHVKVVGFERLPSELIQYVYRIDWYRHSVGYLLHLERRIRAFTTGVPGQLLTTSHWWILVPQNCYY